MNPQFEEALGRAMKVESEGINRRFRNVNPKVYGKGPAPRTQLEVNSVHHKMLLILSQQPTRRGMLVFRSGGTDNDAHTIDKLGYVNRVNSGWTLTDKGRFELSRLQSLCVE